MDIWLPKYLRGKRRDHNYFENWARDMGMRPYDRFRGDPNGDILIADSFNLIDDPPSDRGYEKFYRTGFCIYRDKAWIASSDTYHPGEHSDHTFAGKQKARTDEALKQARDYLAQFVKHKLFNPDDTRAFDEALH